jgi:AraC-like DNA-binding protein
MSHKHLIAQFARLVGGTPKALARIYRLQHVLYSLIPDSVQPLTWAHVAQEAGYYDEAHFYKDFHAYTGQPPAPVCNCCASSAPNIQNTPCIPSSCPRPDGQSLGRAWAEPGQSLGSGWAEPGQRLGRARRAWPQRQLVHFLQVRRRAMRIDEFVAPA